MEKNKEYVTKEYVDNAIKTSYRRAKYETGNVIDDKLKDIRDTVSDNRSDVNDLKSRMSNVERAVYPLEEAVNFIKDDVKEIKEDIKDGFKELKMDFKEYKEDIKDDMGAFSDEVDKLSKRITVQDGIIKERGGNMTMLEWFKSTEGIMTAGITTAGSIIIVLIQIFTR